jgi:hypothetical protein
LQILGFLDAEHILMHLQNFVKFHAGEGRKITTVCTFESFSISSFRSKKQQARKEQFHARTGKKMRMAHFNTLFNFKFSFKKQPPKRPQYFC